MLEIGAGNANMALRYRRYVGHLTLTDVSEEAVDLIRERFRGAAQVDIRRLDLSTEDLPDRFDLVLLSEVLEHVEDDAGFLERAASLLEGGGQLVITVPANEKHRGEEDRRAGHLRRYDEEQIRALAAGAGLEIREFIGWGHPVLSRYQRYYNRNYDRFTGGEGFEMGRAKELLLRSAYLGIYSLESLFRRSRRNSLGFILVLKRSADG